MKFDKGDGIVAKLARLTAVGLLVASSAFASDYSDYRKSVEDGTPQSVMLSYYDGPDTRGFAWQTATTVKTGAIWLLGGAHNASADADFETNQVATAESSSQSDCICHKAHVLGLKPGLYSYRLGVTGHFAYGTFTVDPAKRPLVAVNINDIQTRDADKINCWDRTVAAAKSVLGTTPAELMISGGDLIGGVGSSEPVEWGVVADKARVQFPDVAWVMASGNHDTGIYDWAIEENFQHKSSSTYGCHSFDVGNVHVATVPYYSSWQDSTVGAWLKNDLAACTSMWRIVSMHYGPYTTVDHGYSASESYVKSVSGICKDYKVDLVLQAHDHGFSKTLPYLWSGPGYTKSDSDKATTVNVSPATQVIDGETYYLCPSGTVYISAGCAGHRVGENSSYATSTYKNRGTKIFVDTIKVGPKKGDDASYVPTTQMFGVLKIDGGKLAYDWYLTETDGSATLFDSLRICKSVGPEEIDVPTGAKGLVYSGAAQTGVADGEGYVVSGGISVATNADVYTAFVTPKENFCWRDGTTAPTSVVWTIGQKTVTVTARSYELAVGDPAPDYEATYDGFASGEDEGVLTTSVSFACDYDPETGGYGTYPIVPSGAVATNYTFAYSNGAVRVRASAAVSGLPSASPITYGQTLADVTLTGGTATNAAGESVAGTFAFADPTVRPSVADGGTTPYDVVFTPDDAEHCRPGAGVLVVTVNRAPVTVTADDKEICVGDPRPDYTASYCGWVAGEDASVLTQQPTFVCAYDPETSEAGVYPIVPSGAAAANYAFSYTNGTVHVRETPAGPTVTWGKHVIAYEGLAEAKTNYSGTTDTVLVFTNGVGSFTLPVQAKASLLVVGGGGGGGGGYKSDLTYYGHAGDGGAVVEKKDVMLTNRVYEVRVGAGGAGGDDKGKDGGDDGGKDGEASVIATGTDVIAEATFGVGGDGGETAGRTSTSSTAGEPTSGATSDVYAGTYGKGGEKTSSTAKAGDAGADNTGAGGRGAKGQYVGGHGGSGIVVVRITAMGDIPKDPERIEETLFYSEVSKHVLTTNDESAVWSATATGNVRLMADATTFAERLDGAGTRFEVPVCGATADGSGKVVVSCGGVPVLEYLVTVLADLAEDAGVSKWQAAVKTDTVRIGEAVTKTFCLPSGTTKVWRYADGEYNTTTRTTYTYTQQDAASVTPDPYYTYSDSANYTSGTSQDFAITVTGKTAGVVKVAVFFGSKASYGSPTPRHYAGVYELTVTDAGPVDVPAGKTGLVYDGAEQLGFETDDVVVTGGVAAATDADTYEASVVPKEGCWWRDGSTGPKAVTWSIAPKPATVTADSFTVAPGDPAPVYTAAYDGFVDGAAPSDLTPATLSCAYDPATSGEGAYPIVPSGAAAANYAFSYANGTLIVRAATVRDLIVSQGAVVSGSEDEPIYTFTNASDSAVQTLTLPAGYDATAEILVVGGGGGSGYAYKSTSTCSSNGGNGGCFRNNGGAACTIGAGVELTITVGKGGSGSTSSSNAGGTGGESKIEGNGFATISAPGGSGGSSKVSFGYRAGYGLGGENTTEREGRDSDITGNPATYASGGYKAGESGHTAAKGEDGTGNGGDGVTGTKSSKDGGNPGLDGGSGIVVIKITSLKKLMPTVVVFKGQEIRVTGAAVDTNTVLGELILIYTNTVKGGSLELPEEAVSRFLVVGGGGAGCMGKAGSATSTNKYSGNGGDGGEAEELEQNLPAGSYAIAVGVGGVGVSTSTNDFTCGTAGGDSSFSGSGVSVTKKGGAAGATGNKTKDGTAGKEGANAGCRSNILGGGTDVVEYGKGGTSPSAASGSVLGADGVNYGDGGGGSANGDASGSGRQGVVVVRISGFVTHGPTVVDPPGGDPNETPTIKPVEGTNGVYAIEVKTNTTTVVEIKGLQPTDTVVVPEQIDSVRGATSNQVVVVGEATNGTATVKVDITKAFMIVDNGIGGVTISLDGNPTAVVDVTVGGKTETIRVTPQLTAADDEVVKPMTVDEDEVALGAKTIPGLTYRLNRSTELGGTVTVVASEKAKGVRTRLTDPMAGGKPPQAFYRIEVSK